MASQALAVTERRLERVRAHKYRWAAALWMIVRLVDDRALGEIAAELRRAEIYFLAAAREYGSRTLRMIADNYRIALAVVEREIREREETAEIQGVPHA